MKFVEAMKKAIEGEKIASTRWPKKVYIYVANREIFVVYESGNEQKMTISDVLNWFRLDREWIIIPDEKQTLSDKIRNSQDLSGGINILFQDDVRDSIKLLKERIKADPNHQHRCIRVIDEVFGERLTK